MPTLSRRGDRLGVLAVVLALGVGLAAAAAVAARDSAADPARAWIGSWRCETIAKGQRQAVALEIRRPEARASSQIVAAAWLARRPQPAAPAEGTSTGLLDLRWSIDGAIVAIGVGSADADRRLRAAFITRDSLGYVVYDPPASDRVARGWWAIAGGWAWYREDCQLAATPGARR